IRVNTLIPGMTEGTGGVKALHRTEADYAEALARIPLGRMVTKAELANAASYLLSDFAGYVTGAELVVDGGRSLGRL
ncbi:MAG: SDR family oxidoreductase, partial [Actinobacteria bacterium]|nr:SDR family oxidoreductase [Actinomycetota bacterium]